MTTTSFPIGDPSHVSSARRAASHLAERLGFDEARAGQAALVVTELATNILKHGQRGEVLLTQCHDDDREGLEILAVDVGRGFADFQRSLRDGHSTTGSLGHGLGAVKRNTDVFEVFSLPAKGSAALCRLWGAPGASGSSHFLVRGVSVPIPGEELCGDAWSSKSSPQRLSLLVADGLGHGLFASEAAVLAVDVFSRAPFRSPAEILEEVHVSLRATRGAAVAVLSLSLEGSNATFAGLGNVSGSIVNADGARKSMVSHNGTAGHSARTMHEFTYAIAPGSTVVLHSDGLATQWDPGDYPGLWVCDPAIVAGVLYRDFTRRRDDVTVVVARAATRDADASIAS
jgi:anti-sigma regulatory factor (Ser/Thr protein kinase)